MAFDIVAFFLLRVAGMLSFLTSLFFYFPSSSFFGFFDPIVDVSRSDKSFNMFRMVVGMDTTTAFFFTLFGGGRRRATMAKK